jgi:hypothetical protein
MQELVKNAKHVPSLIPSWKPGPSADKGLAEHVSKLCIPTFVGGQPSLLLHDLGEERTDLDQRYAAHIQNIFSFATHTYVV